MRTSRCQCGADQSDADGIRGNLITEVRVGDLKLVLVTVTKELSSYRVLVALHDLIIGGTKNEDTAANHLVTTFQLFPGYYTDT